MYISLVRLPEFPTIMPIVTAHSATCKSLSTLAPTRAIALDQSNSTPVKSDKYKDFPSSPAQTDNFRHSSSIPKQTIAVEKFYKQ
jgi:hypothetical protein